jgi:hypothetical protein
LTLGIKHGLLLELVCGITNPNGWVLQAWAAGWVQMNVPIHKTDRPIVENLKERRVGLCSDDVRTYAHDEIDIKVSRNPGAIGWRRHATLSIEKEFIRIFLLDFCQGCSSCSGVIIPMDSGTVNVVIGIWVTIDLKIEKMITFMVFYIYVLSRY